MKKQMDLGKGYKIFSSGNSKWYPDLKKLVKIKLSI